jgi:hypothetical protein
VVVEVISLLALPLNDVVELFLVKIRGSLPGEPESNDYVR